jgi:hypothetical protein
VRSFLQRGVLDLAVLAGALVAALAVVVVVGGLLPVGSVPTARPFVESPGPGPTDSGTSPAPSSVRSPTGGAVAVLVGAGDIADCQRFQDDLTADAVETIPGIVFTLGDNAFPAGSPTDFANCYGPSWGRPSIKDRTRPAAGETDYRTPGASGYFEYFGEAAGDSAMGYYAYDAGAWRVYVLNSNCRSIGLCGVGSPQEQWLRADLAANPRQCVVAMWHHPFFSSGSSAGSSSMRAVWRVLQDAGAELVLSGHDQVYERFAPQAADRSPSEQGIVQFVVGTGGGDSDDFIYEAPNSVARASGVAGVLRLELAAESYAFEFLGVSGPEFTDTGRRDCH